MVSELLSNPSMLHAAAVHMPIAAAMLGFIFVVLSAIFHRNNTIRVVTLLLFAIMAGSAWVGIETGEDARDLVPNTASKAITDQISAHAASAERVLYAGLVALVFVAISLIRVDFLRVGGLLCAAVAALIGNVFVAQTGHLGGMLVYNDGIGTPMAHQATASAPVVPEQSVVEEMPATATAETSTETPPVMVVAEPAPETPPTDEEAVEWLPIREIDMEAAKLVSYTRDVWPLLDDQCIVCHESPDPDGDFDITTVESMKLAGKKGGPGVIPGKPDESSIIAYIRGVYNPRMPEDEDPLSDEDLHMLRMWIAAGAIDDSDAPAPEAVPAEEEMTEEAVPAADAPAETPAPEAAPTEEEMKEDAAPAVEAPVEIPAPDAAPVEEKMKEEAAPATEAPVETPAPDATPVEEVVEEAAPAVDAPVETPAPAAAIEEVVEDAALAVEAPVETPAPEATEVAPDVEEDAAPANEV